MDSYKDLIVWQKSMDLAEEAYRITSSLPKEELYSLSGQIRRAAVSIASNIAEGYGRNSVKEYCRFLSIARGSKNEVETQLLLCVRLGYLEQKQLSASFSLCDEIGKMLNALINKLSDSNDIS